MCPSKRRETTVKIHEDETEIEVMCLKAKGQHQGSASQSKARREAYGRFSFRALRKKQHADSLISGFQNCERIHSYHLKSSSLQYFVMADLENEYSYQREFRSCKSAHLFFFPPTLREARNMRQWMGLKTVSKQGSCQPNASSHSGAKPYHQHHCLC